MVASASTSFLASDPIGLWKKAEALNIPLPAGTYRYEIEVADFANVDLASLVFRPAMTLIKTSIAFSDPRNGTTNPKLIPGGVVEYTITGTTPASYTVTSNSILVSDTTPANADFVVTNIGGAGSGPAGFVPGASGLTYTFTSLASTTDDIEFSSDGGTTWVYTPTANANGVDPLVTTVRIRPQGAMAASSNFAIRLRYRIR